MQRNTLFILLLSLLLTSAFIGCDDSTGAEELQIETRIAEDIPANPGADRGAPPNYTLYNLERGEIVTDSVSSDWDLGFSGTNIIVNGGQYGPGNGSAVSLDVNFADVSLAPSSGLTAEMITDWYNYTGDRMQPMFAVLPIEDKTIVVHTGDGEHYAKVRIISYYEGNPDYTTDEFSNMQTRPASRYYTFEYTIQMDGSRELN